MNRSSGRTHAPRARNIEIVALLGALTAFSPMSIDMYLPALPTLARAFAASAAEVQLTLAAFFIGLALGQSLFGPLADRYGRKIPLYAGLALYIAASIGCALAPSIDALAALRFLQALGACAGVVIARAMVRDLFEPQESIRVYSTLMLVMGVAPILAPLVGGYVLVWSGWRAIFVVLALFGLACLAGSLARLPETQRADPTRRLALLPVLAGYVRLLRDRRFMAYALTGGLSTAGMFAYIAGSPFVFIELYHVPAERYGWLFGTNAFGLILASQVNGRLLHRRLGADATLRIANLVQAAAGIALAVCAATGVGGLAGVVIPLFFYVACVGLIAPNATGLAMAAYAKSAGAASALLGTLQFALAAISALVVGAIHSPSAVPMAGVIAVCGVLGLLWHRTLTASA